MDNAMKRAGIIIMVIASLVGAGAFFWHARTLQAFVRDFRATAPEARRALFERYYATLDAHQMATAIEGITAVCHGQTHDLGKVVYAHTKDIGEAFRECGKACTEGCFHGVLMEALGTDDTLGMNKNIHLRIEDLTAKVSTICETASDHRPGNCAHGIGHAFMYLADYHPEIALPLCNAFPTTPLQFYCSGGAYMELDTAGFELPCDPSLPFEAACWTYKTKSFVTNTKNPGDASQKCLTLPDGPARRGCFRGIGFINLGRIETYPDLLPSICRYGSFDDQVACMEGAIEKLADAHESRAIEACKYIGEPLRTECNRAARDKLYSLDKPFERYLK
jgi:hypothetical protein